MHKPAFSRMRCLPPLGQHLHFGNAVANDLFILLLFSNDGEKLKDRMPADLLARPLRGFN
jgi:hypothetical protein